MKPPRWACCKSASLAANHLSGDWNPLTAFQHLAAFSIVAGWVRHWRVEHYIAPIPNLTTPQKPAATAQKIRCSPSSIIFSGLPNYVAELNGAYSLSCLQLHMEPESGRSSRDIVGKGT